MRLALYLTMMIGGAVVYLTGCSTPPAESPTGVGGLGSACTLQGDRMYWSEGTGHLAVVPHSEAPDCPVLEPTPPATR